MEWRLFPEGTVPECSTPGWYLGRDSAPHIDQDIHKGRLAATAEQVKGIKGSMYGDAIHTLSDLGAGDGGFLQSIDYMPLVMWGYDLQLTNIGVAINQRKVSVHYADFLHDPIELGDVVVMTEVLEHLIDPHSMVKRIYDAGKILIASSPWSETGDSHYEHHLWAWDVDGYEKMFTDVGYKLWRRSIVGIFQVVTFVP